MLDDLPFVLYKDRNELPVISGIYIVANDNTVLYVGQSSNLNKRWLYHHRGLQMRRDSRIYWKHVKRSDLNLTEDLFIEELKPTLNGTKIECFDFSPGSSHQVRELILHLNKEGRIIIAQAIDELWQREIGTHTKTNSTPQSD